MPEYINRVKKEKLSDQHKKREKNNAKKNQTMLKNDGNMIIT